MASLGGHICHSDNSSDHFGILTSYHFGILTFYHKCLDTTEDPYYSNSICSVRFHCFKRICIYNESQQRVIGYMIKCFFCVLFMPRIMCCRYLLESLQWGDSNKIFTTYVSWSIYHILEYLQLSLSSGAKEVLHSECHYNRFSHCIECRFKEGGLYFLCTLY